MTAFWRLRVAAGLVEFGGGVHGGDRTRRRRPAGVRGGGRRALSAKARTLRGACPRAVDAQRQADDQRADPAFGDQGGDALERVGLAGRRWFPPGGRGCRPGRSRRCRCGRRRGRCRARGAGEAAFPTSVNSDVGIGRSDCLDSDRTRSVTAAPAAACRPSFLIASAWWRLATSRASSVWTMIRSSTPSRAMWEPSRALKTMLFSESSSVIGPR